MSDNKSSYKSLDEKDEIYLPPCFSGAKFDSIIGYQQHYEKSIENPSQFWMDATRDLYFEKRTRIGLEYNFDVCNGPIYTSFMKGSTSNISYNCLERIIAKGNGTKTAYIFEGNEYGDSFKISYDELYTKVVNCAAVLKSKGVKAGDVVAIYLPMILELPIAMLACLRIGAIHSVIFAGFSSEAVADRIIQVNRGYFY
jgi:acetyl-CoA synthetase